MLFLIVLALFLGLLYLAVLCVATYQWSKVSKSVTPTADHKFVSIIIVARNEEQAILACLHSITTNNYPKEHYEIILMDDHSEDNTVALAESIGIKNLRVLQLSNYNLKDFHQSFKKAGQYYAIQEAKYNIILQTDADCITPVNWISHMAHTSADKDIVTGPILIESKNDFLSRWQTFENIGTMVVTYAGINSNLWQSANAANMIYTKEIYDRYRKDMQIDTASGDDVFLINWAYRNNYNIGYKKSKEAIVRTDSVDNLGDLFSQRLRWATKTKTYNFKGLKILMSGFFVFHFLITFLGVACFMTWQLFFIPFLIVSFAKWLGDIILLMSSSSFFDKRYPLWLSPIFSIAHTLYVVIIGLCGLILNDYNWKGRSVR